MEATEIMNLTVLDSNDASRRGHWMEAHRQGCSHITRAKYPETYAFGEWVLTVSSLEEAAENMASDFIAEGSMTLEESIDAIHFAPCVKLPRHAPAAEVQPELPIETPASVPTGKHMSCPDCGFAFKTPQARCNSRTACAKRAAARNGTLPLPTDPRPVMRAEAEAARPSPSRYASGAKLRREAQLRREVEQLREAPSPTETPGLSSSPTSQLFGTIAPRTVRDDRFTRHPADVLDEYVADLAARHAAAVEDGSPTADALASQLAHQTKMAAYVRTGSAR